MTADLSAALERIEAKLDALIRALADEEDEPDATLEGELMGEERDQDRPL